MTAPIRQCPHCGIRSRRIACCGIILGARRRWHMSTAMIQHVQAFAKARKGLTEEAYRDNVTAVGATSTTKLTRQQHTDLMLRLGRYQDTQKWLTRGQHKAARAQGRVVNG